MSNRPIGAATVLACLLCATALAPAAGVLYYFALDAASSGIDATLSFSADTSGTLIGNWDPNDNPTGTRTKPGLWGSFGETENWPVDVSLSAALGGDVQTHPAGAFRMLIDPASASVEVTGLNADLLGGTPLEVPATITLETESFRTRNPTSVYIGGIPITLPLGSLTVSELAVSQTEDPALGVLTETAAGEYTFIVAPLVNVTATVDFFGNPLSAPPFPQPFPLQGQLVVSGETAQLTSLQTLELSDTQDPNLPLPEVPLDLPTILPPGDTAHLLLTLTLDQIGASLSGSNALVADGVAVHPPLTGDLNCDGAVDFGDINPFVLRLSNADQYAARYPACPDANGDINGNGTVGLDDINPFVALLTAM